MRKPASQQKNASEIVVYEGDIPTQKYETLAHIYSKDPVWLAGNGEYVSSDGDDIRDAARREAIRVAAELGGDALILNYYYLSDVSCSPYRTMGEIRGAVVRFINHQPSTPKQ
jgi:hypothetical protein